MVDYQDKYRRAVSILHQLLRATQNARKGYCLICGQDKHVGHMECEAEIAEADLADLKKE
jgi:hypothetical protein